MAGENLPAQYEPVLHRISQLERSLSRHNGFDISPVTYYNGYANIIKSLGMMAKNGKEIEKQLKHSNSYLAVRDFVRARLFKKKSHTLDELFNMQLAHISSINATLTDMNLAARQELAHLEAYNEHIHAEFEKHMLSIGEKRQKLESIASALQSEGTHPASLRKGTAEYFEAERNERQNRRILSEESHRYRMSLDLIEELGAEKGYLNIFEDFCRTTTQLCERMAERTLRLERHIANTKQAYIIARDQHIGFKAVADAASIMCRNISQMQLMLAKGIRDIGETLGKSQAETYREFAGNIKDSLNSTRNNVNNADARKERMIALYKNG